MPMLFFIPISQSNLPTDMNFICGGNRRKKEWKALMTIIHSNSSNFDLTFIFFLSISKKKSHPVKHKKIQQSGEKNFFSSFHVFFYIYILFSKKEQSRRAQNRNFQVNELAYGMVTIACCFFFFSGIWNHKQKQTLQLNCMFACI